MISDVPEDLSPEDTYSTESVMLEPDSPKIAGREKPDKEEGALVIQAKATMGENTIINVKDLIQRRVALSKPKMGKYRAPQGTAYFALAKMAACWK